jgi:hypothetical protein
MEENVDVLAARRARSVHMWVGTAIVVAMTLGSAIVGRVQPMTLDVAHVMAGLFAFGTVVIGVFGSRSQTYPRWAWAASTAIMAVLIFASSFWVDAPVWKKDFFPSAWMLPWVLVMMGSTAGRKSGKCSPAHSRSGWIMVLGTTIVTLILLFASLFSGSIR